MLDQAKAELNISKIGLECKNDQNQANFEISQISDKIPNFGLLEGTEPWYLQFKLLLINKHTDWFENASLTSPNSPTPNI